MTEYLVSWLINIDADTFEEAAEKALRVHRDPGSAATVFEVTEESTGRTVNIDVDVAGTKRINVDAATKPNTSLLIDALIDCYDRAEEADEALQEFFPELEHVVNDDICERLKTTLRQHEYIERIVVSALGGVGKFLKLRNELHSRKEETDGE